MPTNTDHLHLALLHRAALVAVFRKCSRRASTIFRTSSCCVARHAMPFLRRNQPICKTSPKPARGGNLRHWQAGDRRTVERHHPLCPVLRIAPRWRHALNEGRAAFRNGSLSRIASGSRRASDAAAPPMPQCPAAHGAGSEPPGCDGCALVRGIAARTPRISQNPAVWTRRT
jgi:hypothetical protein